MLYALHAGSLLEPSRRPTATFDFASCDSNSKTDPPCVPQSELLAVSTLAMTLRVKLTSEQIRRLGERARVVVITTHADTLTSAQRRTVRQILQRDLAPSELAIDADSDDDSDNDSGHNLPPPSPLLIFAPEEGFKRVYPTHELDCLDDRVSDLGRLYGSIMVEEEQVGCAMPMDMLIAHTLSQLRSASWEDYYEKFRTDRLTSAHMR